MSGPLWVIFLLGRGLPGAGMGQLVARTTVDPVRLWKIDWKRRR